MLISLEKTWSVGWNALATEGQINCRGIYTKYQIITLLEGNNEAVFTTNYT